MNGRDRRTLASLRQEIRSHGVALAHGCVRVPVGRRRVEHVRTTYTIGLTRQHGHPEIISAHLPDRESESVLLSVAQAVADGMVMAAGWRFRVGQPGVDERECGLVVVDQPEHLWLATALYGPTISALQVVPADEFGLLPWESGIGTELLLGMPPAA